MWLGCGTEPLCCLQPPDSADTHSSHGMAQLTIQQIFDLALQHHRAGRLHEAEQFYRQILDRDPQNADALHLLGVIAHQAGRNDIAADFILRAIALNPRFPEAHSNLSHVLKDMGNPDQAIAAGRQAIFLNFNFPDAHNNLGNALREKGQLDEAIAAYRQAIALRPDYGQAHSNLGNALREKGKLDEAIVACRRAILLKPDHADAYNNLGTALHESGQFDEALNAYRQAIALKPAYAQAQANLAVSLQDSGQFVEALAAHRQAIALDNHLPLGHLNLAYALLIRGDYQHGWEEHEWRWKCKESSSIPRGFAQPPWDGHPLDDRVLLLHAEQGLGDAIQFVRYLPFVARRARRIVVECQPQLQRLFQSIVQTIPQTACVQCQFVSRGDALPPFDFHCPLLSLPLVFKTTLESIPADVPYLFPEPNLVELWRNKLNPAGTELKIAINWAGNPAYKGDRTRSISLQRLAPLARARGAIFYSVQKGAAAAQVNQSPTGLRLVDLSPDFDNTAAIMSLMDLVITTDTSMAHLAGALGRPTWVMLQFVADWRWMLDRGDSPWYPSMRLFRQPAIGDWDGVVEEVAQALAARAKDPNPG